MSQLQYSKFPKNALKSNPIQHNILYQPFSNEVWRLPFFISFHWGDAKFITKPFLTSFGNNLQLSFAHLTWELPKSLHHSFDKTFIKDLRSPTFVFFAMRNFQTPKWNPSTKPWATYHIVAMFLSYTKKIRNILTMLFHKSSNSKPHCFHKTFVNKLWSLKIVFLAMRTCPNLNRTLPENLKQHVIQFHLCFFLTFIFCRISQLSSSTNPLTGNHNGQFLKIEIVAKP